MTKLPSGRNSKLKLGKNKKGKREKGGWDLTSIKARFWAPKGAFSEKMVLDPFKGGSCFLANNLLMLVRISVRKSLPFLYVSVSELRLDQERYVQ